MLLVNQHASFIRDLLVVKKVVKMTGERDLEDLKLDGMSPHHRLV
jgi:hypothetical protein